MAVSPCSSVASKEEPFPLLRSEKDIEKCHSGKRIILKVLICSCAEVKDEMKELRMALYEYSGSFL